jgi:hypothetical protein
MSNESTLSRQPSGVPAGGQFAGTVKPETTTALAPVHPAPRKSSNGVFDVVDTVSERLASDEHITRTMIHMGGKPDAKAQANLVGLRMERAEQPDALRTKLDFLADSQSKATVLLQSAGNGGVTAREGTLVVAQDGSTALLNKGPRTGKGVYLIGHGAKAKILGLAQGYGAAPALADQFHSYADALPHLEPATFDGIPDVGENEEPPSEIAAVYVFDHPGFESSQDGRGSVFFVTDFMPGDGGNSPDGEGIVNGYGVYSGSSGLCSEHGSMYASQLKRWGGRVKGYEPGSHTFKDAMDFGNAAERNDDIESCWESVKAASA